MRTTNKEIWPFTVPPEAEQTELERKKLKFLVAAHEAGATAFRTNDDNYGAESNDRIGEVVWRGRNFCEIQLISSKGLALRAYVLVSDFTEAGDAVLNWIDGIEKEEIIEKLRPFLFTPRGAENSFIVE